MKRARMGELLEREPGGLDLAVRSHAPAAGAGGASGGSPRADQASQKAGEAPLPEAEPPPARRGRGACQFDDIDVEFYLDTIGGE